MAQPETGGMMMTDGESDKLESLLDDEEITIPSQDRHRKIAEGRNIDIRDEQSENTQREDWLLPTEPIHGARQTGGERPPARENQYSGMRQKFLPSGIRVGPSVCRQDGGL